MPIAGLTSDSTHTTHRKPTANRWTYVRLQAHNKQTRKPNANSWAYIRLQTHNPQETNCQSLGLRQTPNKKTHTKKEKGARRDLARSPAYVPHLSDKGKGKEVANPRPIAALKPSGGIAKEGTCFHCGKTGHWKRNCPKYLEDKKNGVETSTSGNFVINLSTSASWVLDTGCGSHICTNVQELTRSRDLAKGEVDLRVSYGAKVAALAVGTFVLTLPSCLIIQLENCYYVEKTPYEIWSGKRPHMSYMKIWGCEVYVKRQISTKLEPKSDKFLFVGYPKETRGYYFYNPSEGKVFVARTGVFLEKDFNSKGTSGRKVELEEIQESQSIDTPMEELEKETQVVV
ncbi:hypothetical protein KIW84_023081 [Lathyrus oleraceus]|uniref:CCHC-type domain-containing protein n=1 Tax=Pisum sativum TaxID=3888 RepID=A0A9D5BBG0_PEA|nr:hypothetical protein KIW84_023081 [Pisum sativum]